jgi:calcium-dependent protein kinase
LEITCLIFFTPSYHSTVKFENILFESLDDEAEIKIVDFGLSKKFVNTEIGQMHEGVGTLYSMAPQVLLGMYSSEADMWSVGVITYMLLSSHMPFFDKNRSVMIERIMWADYNFKKDYWNNISDEAKDLINKLLLLDPQERLDGAGALKHKWLSTEFKLEDRMPSPQTKEMVEGNLLVYKETSRLKKIALNVCMLGYRSNSLIEFLKFCIVFAADRAQVKCPGHFGPSQII